MSKLRMTIIAVNLVFLASSVYRGVSGILPPSHATLIASVCVLCIACELFMFSADSLRKKALEAK